MKHIHQWLLATIMIFLLGACVTGPTNGKIVSPNHPIEFNGYASNPGAEVQIKAFNNSSNEWDVIKTTTASTSPFTVGGDDLYSWSTEVVFSELDEWQCYWSSSCILNPPDATVSVTVEEPLPNGGVLQLVTFEKGFLGCIGDNIGNGAYAAGWTCRSKSSPVLYLITIT